MDTVTHHYLETSDTYLQWSEARRRTTTPFPPQALSERFEATRFPPFSARRSTLCAAGFCTATAAGCSPAFSRGRIALSSPSKPAGPACFAGRPLLLADDGSYCFISPRLVPERRRHRRVAIYVIADATLQNRSRFSCRTTARWRRCTTRGASASTEQAKPVSRRRRACRRPVCRSSETG